MLLLMPAAVFRVGEGLARWLRAGGARDVTVVGNWKRLDAYRPEPARVDAERRRLGLEGARLVVSYFGVLDPTREIEPLLEAVGRSPEVVLLIAGRGIIRERVMAAAQQWPNIRWLNWVPLADLPLYVQLCDAVYCCLSVDRHLHTQLGPGNNDYSAPNKLFEAFAAGKAVIARRGLGEMGEILEQVRAGVLLDAVTPATLEAAFLRLQDQNELASLQREARRACARFDWSEAEARLRELYSRILAPRRP
jgi:glycosyltransferase involved in cell wall biosynthesis